MMTWPSVLLLYFFCMVSGDVRVSAAWMLGSDEEGEAGGCLFPSLRFQLPQETQAFPLSTPMDALLPKSLPHLPLAGISNILNNQGTTLTASARIFPGSDYSMQLDPAVEVTARLSGMDTKVRCVIKIEWSEYR